jgi:hypothetical protein
MLVYGNFNTPRNAAQPMQGLPHEQARPSVLKVEFIEKLASTMLVGQMNGDLDDEVGHIFSVLSKLLGDGRHLRVSLSIASAIGGDPAPARKLLNEGIDDWPDAEAAKVSVAMALKICGDPQWIHVCEHTLAVSNNNDARLFARQLLAQAEKT